MGSVRLGLAETTVDIHSRAIVAFWGEGDPSGEADAVVPHGSRDELRGAHAAPSAASAYPDRGGLFKATAAPLPPAGVVEIPAFPRLGTLHSTMTQIVKTEIVVAVIGAVGVTGTIVGTVVGALFQANGGHAQAAAARAAANTAARAAWHQTMRDLRWTVLSAYLRAAAEADEADEAAHRTGAPADVEAARKSFHAYRLAYAEAELIASDAVLPALTTLNERLQASHLQALQRALATAAIRELEDRRRLGNSAASHSLLRLEEGMDQGLAQMEMVDLGRDVLRLLPETSERLYRISIILSFPRTYDEIINYTSAAEARSDLLAIDRTRLVNVIRTELGTTA